MKKSLIIDKPRQENGTLMMVIQEGGFLILVILKKLYMKY